MRNQKEGREEKREGRKERKEWEGEERVNGNQKVV